MRDTSISGARVVLYCAIPALAIVIATRQAYLNTWYGLSTWKGGGMGMFASADGGSSRFTRIYVEMPDGGKQPIVQMTPAEDRLLDRALWYPTHANFRELALSLRSTSFIAVDRPSPVNRADSNGQSLGPAGYSHYLLRADGPRAEGDVPDWTLLIEYWTISFDPGTRLAQASLSASMRFGPEEQ